MQEQTDYRNLQKSMFEAFDTLNLNFFTVEIKLNAKKEPIDVIYREISPATQLLIGKPKEEIIGRSRKQLFGNISDEFPEKFCEVAQTGKPQHFQSYDAAFKRYYDVYAWRVIGNHVAAIITDITERKEAELTLKERTEQLERTQKMLQENACQLEEYATRMEELVKERTQKLVETTTAVQAERKRLFDVLETLPSYVVLLDKDYHVPFANKVFRERFGESHGRRCYEYLFNQDLPCENCETYKVLKTNGPQHWEWTGPDNRNYDIYDYPFKDSDGSKLILEMGIDVTERKKAETALQTERQHFFVALESLPVMVIILNHDHKIIFSNTLFRERFGESSSKHCFEFLFGKNAPCEWCQAYNVLTVGQPRYWCLNCPDGSVFDVFNSPFIDADGSTAILQVYVDVTERLKLEKQLKDSERLAAIGATAGMVGHDLKNPLQGIIGELYFARKDLSKLPESSDRESLKDSLQQIETSVTYMNKIVMDLQDFARPLKPELAETDLTEVVNYIFKTINFPENVQFRVDFKGVPKLRTDPSFIRRSLTNLVNNAIQAMPNGGALTILATQLDGKVLISVQDTGVGIPNQIKPKLFTPMMTTKAKGQGFGLAVAKRLVEALNGKISFESEEGNGTKFIIELPIH